MSICNNISINNDNGKKPLTISAAAILTQQIHVYYFEHLWPDFPFKIDNSNNILKNDKLSQILTNSQLKVWFN